MNTNEKDINTKKSYKRDFLKIFKDDDLINDKFLIEEKVNTFTKELMILPSKISNINISKDSYIGSKSTRATSKKTHPKLRFNK